MMDSNPGTDLDGHVSNDNREPLDMEMDMDLGRSDNDDMQSGIVGGQITEDRAHYDRVQHRNGDKHDNVDRRSAETRMIQVINVAPTATLEQMTDLFGFLGDIVNIDLHHSNQNSDANLKVCFVEFAKPSSVLVAQHLTNTVFIDRALIVLPYDKPSMPNRETALASITESNLTTNFNHGVISQLTIGTGGTQVITTIDPRLTALNLPQYPQLPLNTDPTRLEEIRRTVYIGNLDSTIPPDQVMKFFNDIGEVKYIRMAGDDTQPTRFAFVEFTHQSSIANALQHNGFVLGSRALKINHSNNAIVRPQHKIDVDDVSKRASDNQSSHNLTSRDRHHASRGDRERVRDRDRYHDRRLSPRISRSRRSRSRELDSISRRRSKSRDRPSRRSRSREKASRRRSRSRESRRRRSRSRSSDRSRSKHHKSSRR